MTAPRAMRGRLSKREFGDTTNVGADLDSRLEMGARIGIGLDGGSSRAVG